MTLGLRIALLDGPLPTGHPALAGQVALAPGRSAAAEGHAAAVAGALLSHCPAAQLVNLAVFGARLATDAACLAEALRLAAGSGVALVHCSLGLARRDPAVEAAAAVLAAAGIPLVAAAAARGGPVYPAALPGVVSVQGDARCGPGDWSLLGLPTARFGACPRAVGGAPGGASLAAAHLTGHLAALLAAGATDPLAALEAGAAHLGRERRTAACAG